MKSTENKVFVITGASAGLGRAFAEAALGAGHTVVGTIRLLILFFLIVFKPF